MRSTAIAPTAAGLAGSSPRVSVARAVDPARLGELATRAAAGDANAFRLLVEQTTPIVYRLALRILSDEALAEDAVQETFVRAWRALPTLNDPQATLAWVCRIARFTATDAARARTRRAAVPIDDDDNEENRAIASRLLDANENADALVARAEERAFVRRAIDALPDMHRLVILLREIDGLSYAEVAAALDVPVGTVESRLFRARAALAKHVTRLAGKQGFWPW